MNKNLRPGLRVKNHAGMPGTLKRQELPGWWSVYWDQPMNLNLNLHQDRFLTPLDPKDDPMHTPETVPAEPTKYGFKVENKNLMIREISDGIVFEISDGILANQHIVLPAELAENVALAALKSKGITSTRDNTAEPGTPEDLQHIAWRLGEHLKAADRIARDAEAKAKADEEFARREALTADAKILHGAAIAAAPHTCTWDELGRTEQGMWLAVAEAARTRYGVKA